MLDVLDDLEQAVAGAVPGQERAWAERVGQSLARVEGVLRHHAAEAEAPAGLFARVDLTRPSFARQVGTLRHEHEDFLVRAAALQREAEAATRAFQPPDAGQTALPEPARAGAIPDFNALRRDAQQFLAALRHHYELENDLVQETVTMDIGAGD